MQRIAVVGASLAGLRATEALRREGFDGTIDLIGDEPHIPYDRPPLSKQVLAGEWDPDRITLTDSDKLNDLGIQAHFGTAATSLDVASKTVTLANGQTISADGVVIATGARCRTIGEPLGGVFTLRNLDDAIAIRNAFDGSPARVAVVGAGFIGAEVAATARERDLAVTMIEMATAPFERSMGVEMGAVLAQVHRDQGVDLRLGVGVRGFRGTDQVEAVELTDGSVVEADLVVVGVGVVPNVEWLAGSGLDITNGVLCDETSLAAPGVVAAGDIARWPNPHFAEMMRVEHWDNAITQATHAAKRLLHGAERAGAYSPTPWFWSDQYDRKIQLAGRTTNFDQFKIVSGDIDSRTFAAIYGRNERIVAVLGFNRPRHVMRYRAMIDDQASFTDALGADF